MTEVLIWKAYRDRTHWSRRSSLSRCRHLPQSGQEVYLSSQLYGQMIVFQTSAPIRFSLVYLFDHVVHSTICFWMTLTCRSSSPIMYLLGFLWTSFQTVVGIEIIFALCFAAALSIRFASIVTLHELFSIIYACLYPSKTPLSFILDRKSALLLSEDTLLRTCPRIRADTLHGGMD